MASKPLNVVIVGGHGKVSLRLTHLLTARPNTKVTSIIRSPDHIPSITELSATPLLLSLEDAPVSDFAAAFKAASADVVYFSAGAGGQGGPERTRKVDEEGAIKVFDALESLAEGERPRLILVSAIDTRDPEKPPPAYYTEEDLNVSARVRSRIAAYMAAKYAADKNLAARTAFKWTMLRPGGLTDGPGTGTGVVGHAHLSKTISRDDVAKVLFLLLERDDAAGLGIDLVGGDEPLENALDAFIAKGESDFLG
ncbi:NAD(P)-binding protein [Trametopsis cervina]|nr:NAD(P)-binding protein [Trametopsis cervina]